MYSNKERAENYRLIATGLHVLARTAQHDDSRRELLDLAQRYDRLAEKVEQLPDSVPPVELPAGGRTH